MIVKNCLQYGVSVGYCRFFYNCRFYPFDVYKVDFYYELCNAFVDVKNVDVLSIKK